ncbi:MAG: hypothetical protein ACKO18_00905, partial [Bacteroidota bacterium]
NQSEALGRDKHTLDPLGLVAVKGVNPTEQQLLGPNPIRPGQVLRWNGPASEYGLAQAAWYPMATGMLGQPCHREGLRNGMIIAPDLPPGAYWVRIQAPGQPTLGPLKWIISP